MRLRPYFVFAFSLILLSPLCYAEDYFEETSYPVQADYTNTYEPAGAYDFEFAESRESNDLYAENSYYNYQSSRDDYYQPRKSRRNTDYSERVPNRVVRGEKVIVVDPNSHTWAAYANGKLIRSGLASAGAKWCRDIKRPCKTKAGTFRIYSLGSSNCKSTRYPLGKGGAPMPYCMYFNGNQGLHGSYQLGEGNFSHGCVRMSVESARWIRYNFAEHGTKVVVKPY